MTNRPDDRKPWVFLNYRGKDIASSAAYLETRLREAFGPSSVFLDHQSISLGHDFHRVIVDAVQHRAVLLAIIGDGWLDEDASGHRLIDDPDDWVRRELPAALDRNVLIIPC